MSTKLEYIDCNFETFVVLKVYRSARLKCKFILKALDIHFDEKRQDSY